LAATTTTSQATTEASQNRTMGDESSKRRLQATQAHTATAVCAAWSDVESPASRASAPGGRGQAGRWMDPAAGDGGTVRRALPHRHLAGTEALPEIAARGRVVVPRADRRERRHTCGERS